jgi:ribosomal protein L11 methylase PrmA
MDRSEIVKNWIIFHQDSKLNENLFNYWEIVDYMCRTDPNESLKIIIELVKESPNDIILANIAAGPLEDLINNFIVEVIDDIEELARQNPKFRRCLSGVWLNDSIDIKYLTRLKKYLKAVDNPL